MGVVLTLGDTASFKAVIDNAWENRADINSATKGEIRDTVEKIIDLLDSGVVRVADKSSGSWQVNDWAKKAILLSFRLNDSKIIGANPSVWYDKVPQKFSNWDDAAFVKAGFRAVPGSYVRRGAYVGKDVVMMPSFINIGAYVDSGTMVDTWTTIGSCAQIGKNCHISGGVGIGGVLEPLQAAPVIIEDNCFIGARSEIAEGVIIEEGAVISMGVFIGASTKIIDRETGEVLFGRVPANAVVVAGTMAGKPMANGEASPGLQCAVIVKRADAKTRSKTSINDILRSL